ncbi:hypothetical protein H7198_00305 [Fructobacillus sp. CRL 2054]|uniref:hypothetical protein n=1 Tax=Fructobacillus sp. CRL 2054 TaxID=2763007 RepID=UPI0023794FAE|nr:hypothetical protein [Fructobacillus sp. CRL 2054]MDD9138058.1 hypothetical protein [Fructobacillus sp. CRL 2054]
MKKKQWIWIVIAIIVVVLGVVFIKNNQSKSSNNNSATQKSSTTKSKAESSSSSDEEDDSKPISIASGKSKTVNGLKINVKSITATDYKTANSRPLAKVEMEVKNTTKKDMYIIAAAPKGAFNTGLAKSNTGGSFSGLLTDDISEERWTSSISQFSDDQGKLQDNNMISNQLQKSGGAILGESANFQWMCWKLTPGQVVSGDAYGIYDQNPENSSELPVLKVNSSAINVSKSNVDAVKKEYDDQFKASDTLSSAFK